MKIRRIEEWLIEINSDEPQMSANEVRDMINGKQKGNLRVANIDRMLDREFRVTVERTLEDLPDTIKAM